MITENANKVCHALIADDDRANRIILASTLRLLGIECSFSENGIEAIEATKAEVFDLIFMDLMMPKMDGIEASKEIRKNPNYKEIPIIITTARVGLERTKIQKELGVVEIIEKPILQDKLYPVIIEYFPTLTMGGTLAKAKDTNPIFTVKSFTSYCEENRFDAEKLAKLFIKDSEKYILKAQKLIKKEKLKALIKPIHTLAGGAGSLSAEQLSNQGRAIEKLLKQDQPIDLILPAFDQLKIEYNKVKNILLEFLANNK